MNAMRDWSHTLDRFLGTLEDWVMATALAAAACLGLFQVVLRYLFEVGFDWVEAVLVMLVVYSALIGASVAVRRGLHVRLDVVVDKLPPRPRWAVYLLGNVLCLFYTLTLWYYGLKFFQQVIAWGVINIQSDLPEWLHQFSVPIGMGLMSIRYVQEIRRLLWGGPTFLRERRGDEN